MKSISILRILALVALALGCEKSATAPDGWRSSIGRVEPTVSFTPAIWAPAEVQVGEDFTVTVTTLGSSSCTRANGITAVVQGLVAELTPYDWTAPSGSPCTKDLRAFPRETRIRFNQPGPAVVRLRGVNGEGTVTTFDVHIDVRDDDTIRGTASAQELRDQRARWLQRNPSGDYRFDTQRSCFCGPQATAPVRITVRDHRVVSVLPLENPSILDAESYYTIEQLFDRAIAEAERGGYVEVRYYRSVPVPAYLVIGILAYDAGTAYSVENIIEGS